MIPFEERVLSIFDTLPAIEKKILAEVAEAWGLDPKVVLFQGCRHCNEEGRFIIRDGHIRDLYLDISYYVFHPDWPDQFDENGNLKSDNIEYLSNRKLLDVPPSIVNAKYLETLHAGGNQISRFPAMFERLTSLRMLDLSYNQIQAIDAPLLQT